MSRFRMFLFAGAIPAAVLLLSAPSGAQSPPDFKLLDQFVLTVGGAYSDTDTKLRLDSKRLGLGTELDLESDLGLDEGASSLDVTFEWQVARRHRLFASYLTIDRSDTQTASREFQLGDLIVPVEATYYISFDIGDYRIGYTYYPWLKDRWVVGFVFGLRVLDLSLRAGIDSTLGDVDLGVDSEDASVAGPLPFLGIDYRKSLSRRWVMTARGGWLYAKVGDYKGSQWLAQVSFENRITRHFGVGASGGYSYTDVDTDKDDFTGHAELSYATGRIFGRVFWN